MGVTQSPSPGPKDKSNPKAIALMVAGAYFLAFLDGTIVSTSLPSIAKELKVSALSMNAGVTAYILSVAAFTPISSWLSDRFGSKEVFTAALLLFTLASAACGLAGTLTQFVAARIFQGMGGAVLMPIGRLIVLRSSSKEDLLQATSLITWPALTAPVLGPVIGGFITGTFGWRWNFLLNLPLGLLAILCAIALLPDGKDRVERKLDIIGAVLVCLSLFLFVFGLDRLGQRADFSSSIAFMIAGLILSTSAIGWFRRVDSPLLNFSPFKTATFFISNATTGPLTWIATNATTFLLPLMMQLVWGYSIIKTGWWLLVYFLGNLMMKMITTPILKTWGFRNVMTVSGISICLSLIACGTLTQNTAIGITAFVLFAAGAARSMQMTALSTLAFADVPKTEQNSAATMFSMIGQISQAIGVALAAVVLSFASAIKHQPALGQADFTLVFTLIAIGAGIGGLLCLRLAPDAGARVSGHNPT